MFVAFRLQYEKIGFTMKKELRTYRTKEGKEPFTEWLTCLKDKVARAQIANRLDRIASGNYGDYKPIGEGIFELRIHCSAGYRIYFAQQEKAFLLLLIGGSKKTQKRDIEQEKKYWAEFRERYYD